MLPQSSYILTTLGQLQFYKSLYITTIPTFSHINPDVQSAKFNKNSDEYHARTYIYSDEKRKTVRHNLTINPSSIHPIGTTYTPSALRYAYCPAVKIIRKDGDFIL